MFEYKGKTYEGAQALLDNYTELSKKYYDFCGDKEFREKYDEAWDAMFAYWMKLLKDATVGMKDVPEDDYDEVYYGLLDEINILIRDMFEGEAYTDYEVTYSDIEKSYEDRIYYFEDFAPSNLVFGIEATRSPYYGIEFGGDVSPTAYVKVPITKYEYRPVGHGSDENE